MHYSIQEIANNNREFLSFYNPMKLNTLLCLGRCFLIYQLSKQLKNLEGNVSEVGVYKGGTSYLIGKCYPEKEIYIFDTFKGMPVPDRLSDGHNEGDFKSDYNEVVEYLKDLKNIKIYQGIFPITADPIYDKIFCFVHIDADLYRSIYESCLFFYERMVIGGMILFDDYGFYKDCKGAKEAVDDFFENKKESVIYLSTGQALIIKL